MMTSYLRINAMKLSEDQINELWVAITPGRGKVHEFARAIEAEAYNNGQEDLKRAMGCSNELEACHDHT